MPSVIETVNLVDAGEVADEIVKRLACNELSPETGEQVRVMAKHGSVFFNHIVGFGPKPFTIETVLKPDGSINLALNEANGCPVWRTTLKAPPPPPRQVHVTHEVHCPHDDGYLADEEY